MRCLGEKGGFRSEDKLKATKSQDGFPLAAEEAVRHSEHPGCYGAGLSAGEALVSRCVTPPYAPLITIALSTFVDRQERRRA